MTEEQKQQLEKSKKRIEMINKFRLVFLFLAIILLLFVFWGGKIWDEYVWFINARQKVYNFMWYDIVLLVIATFAKLFATMQHNVKVKKWSRD